MDCRKAVINKNFSKTVFMEVFVRNIKELKDYARKISA